MSSTSKTHRPTQQKRSARSESRILAAAEHHFSRRGFERTRISDIISKAGCSNGTFYFRFGSKREVFDVMLKRYILSRREALETLDMSRSVHGSVENLLDHYADTALSSMRANHGMYRAAQEISLVDKDVWQALTDLAVISGERITAVAHEYADEVGAEDPKEALRHALQVIIMISLQTALGAGPLFPKDLDVLRRVIVKAALGTLV